jgi:hypothetical protein
MTTEEALILLEKFLSPDCRLKDIQELVFRQAWEGKTYQEIADESGYSPEHIRDVGFRLWQLLGRQLETKVTKHNLHGIFRHLAAPAAAIAASPSGLSLVCEDVSLISRDPAAPVAEFPGVPLGLSSPFYIERPPIEQRCFGAVLQAGSLIRIAAPQHMGKTSLLNRILYAASQAGCKTVRLNFQQADQAALKSLNRFLRWFCKSISWKLNLDALLDDYWDSDQGLVKSSCTRYFEDYLLKQINAPLVVGLDEVDRIFAHPQLAQDFLPLLRVWHEEANENELWQRFHLVVVHATELYLPLQVHQSPFNVGLPIRLPELTPNQVDDLATCYGLPWTNEQTNQLMALVGGHPYLIQLALYHLYRGDLEFPQLLADASTDFGIYSSHLRRQWETVSAHSGSTDSGLLNELRQILTRPDLVASEGTYQLQRLGIIWIRGHQVRFRCQLYEQYFQSRLMEHDEALNTLHY